MAGFQFLLPAIQRLPDKIERVAVANDVAGYLGVDAGLVLENFRKAAMDRRDKKVAPVVEPLRADEKILLNLLGLGRRSASGTDSRAGALAGSGAVRHAPHLQGAIRACMPAAR